MRSIWLSFVLPALCLPLAADSTGRLQGTVLNQGKKPVAAKIVLSRTDIKWSKELTPKPDGSFIQVGLEPKLFEITVSAEGYVTQKDQIKIPLGDVVKKDFLLLTPEQSRALAPTQQQAEVDPAAQLDNEGRDAFNSAVSLVNEKKFFEALAPIEKAYTNLTESAQLSKDEAAKAELAKILETVEKVYGRVLFEVGKKDAAEPFLKKAVERDAKNQYAIQTLLTYYGEKKDKENQKKYQAMLDELVGPRPENAYNQGVEAFNANRMKEAKAHIQKAIEIDPKFSDSYYMLGMIEFNNNNLKGAKEAFHKYLEVAPNGKKAGEVKMFLKELK